jgi:hypothetical protein
MNQAIRNKGIEEITALINGVGKKFRSRIFPPASETIGDDRNGKPVNLVLHPAQLAQGGHLAIINPLDTITQ